MSATTDAREAAVEAVLTGWGLSRGGDLPNLRARAVESIAWGLLGADVDDDGVCYPTEAQSARRDVVGTDT